jgi:hypothetical protein
MNWRFINGLARRVETANLSRERPVGAGASKLAGGLQLIGASRVGESCTKSDADSHYLLTARSVFGGENAMRLTLRTMLAYLDEQLDRPQMEEIGQKIKESGVASGMIDRIRTSMHKHRMEAPKLEGRGIGKDANSVAEYLDNVLDKDEVPELEQLCLNSDMHLAEVAACHQMLSVLPRVDFEIDADLRGRMYAIPSRMREASREPSTEADADSVRPSRAEVKAPSGKGVQKRKKKKSHKVPEYFKHAEPTSSRWTPLILTAALVFVALAFGLYATREQWMKNFGWQTAATNSPANTTSTNKSNEEGKSSDADANTAKNAEGEKSKSEATEETKPAEEKNAGASTEKAADATPEAGAEENAIKPEVAIPPEGIASEGPPTPPPGDAKPTTDGKPEAPVSARTPEVVGDSPAIAWDQAAKGWSRVGKGQALPWDGALVLIGSRVSCQMATGLNTTIVGPSEVRFEKAAGDPDAVWVVDSGRLVLDAKDAGGATAKWTLAGRSVQTKFVSPDCQAAIEVVRKTPNGVDPANPEEAPPSVYVDVLRGAIAITSGEMERVVEAGSDVEIDATGMIKDLSTRGAPLWVDELTASETAKQSSKELAKRLANDKEPLSITLQELAGDNRINVAALAAQALAQLGQIKPLCDQFRDVQYKLYWRTNHAYLKQLMQSSPAAAEMMRQQLEEHFPSESEPVYRILIGYTKDQFVDEGRQLIGSLESESLMQRVLAYQTLVDLVGPRGGKYQPEEALPLRAKAVASWIEAFDSGKMKVKEPAEGK